MKYTAVLSLAMATLTLGQTLADIPSCALPCLNDAVSQTTSCEVTDIDCICQDFDAVNGAAAGCVLGACGQDVALNKVLPAAKKLCDGKGDATGKPKPTKSQKPGSSVTATVVPPPPVTNTQAPTTVPTAGAAGFAPVGGLAMLALGALAL